MTLQESPQMVFSDLRHPTVVSVFKKVSAYTTPVRPFMKHSCGADLTY